jgi:membrane associated rhomboid family serine protease
LDRPANEDTKWTTARQPVFNAPAVVLALIAVLVVIHAGLSIAPDAWNVWFLYAFAFVPARLSDPGFPSIPGSSVWSFITYAFLHGNWMHLIFNSIWLLVFGTPVARYLGGARFLMLVAVSALAGALASLVLHWGQVVIVIGASGAVSGLLGTAIPIMFARPALGGRRPLQPMELLSNRQALLFMLVFLAITIFSGASGWTGNSFMEDGGIAWEAHLGGFIAGLVTFYLIAPRRVA